MLTIPVERITEASSASGLPITAGATPSGTENLVAARIDQRNLHNFLIAERDHAFAQAVLRCRRAAGGEPAVSREAGAEEICRSHSGARLLRSSRSRGSHRAATKAAGIPHGRRERAVAAAIRVRCDWMKSERAQNFFDIAIRNIRAHHAQQFLARQVRFRCGGSRRGYTSTTPARSSPPATC